MTTEAINVQEDANASPHITRERLQAFQSIGNIALKQRIADELLKP